MLLRLLTYNILLGGQDRLSHLLAVLQRQQPDVVALIEANVQEHVTMLAQALGMQFAFLSSFSSSGNKPLPSLTKAVSEPLSDKQ